MNKTEFNFILCKLSNMSSNEIKKELSMTNDEYKTYNDTMKSKINELKKIKKRVSNIGDDFQKYTSYFFSDQSDQSKGIKQPPAIKEIIGNSINLIPLENLSIPEKNCAEVIQQRKSIRDYKGDPISLNDLSWLLYATQSVKKHHLTEKVEVTFRNVPSAGARHPFETYLFINHVQDIEKGLYHFNAKNNSIVLISSEPELFEKLSIAAFEQSMIKASAVTFIWTALPYRMKWRYQQRGYRYLYLDAGHVGQNLHLAAETLDCGACMIGAFSDELMNNYLNIDGINEFVIYMATVGKKI